GRPPQAKAGEFAFRGKLKNMSHRRQNVARLEFKVWMTDPARRDSQPAILPVEGDYLPVGEAIEFRDKRVRATAETNLFGVEQNLDLRYAPVKRIDKIALGYHAHRTASMPLVMSAISEAEIKAQSAGNPTPPTDPNVSAQTGSNAPSEDTSNSKSGL